MPKTKVNVEQSLEKFTNVFRETVLDYEQRLNDCNNKLKRERRHNRLNREFMQKIQDNTEEVTPNEIALLEKNEQLEKENERLEEQLHELLLHMTGVEKVNIWD